MIIRTTSPTGQYIRAGADLGRDPLGVFWPDDRLVIADSYRSALGTSSWIPVSRGRVVGFALASFLVEARTRRSKLGFHIDIVQYPGQVDQIIAAGTTVLKVIHTLEILQRVHTALPDSTLIARHWEVGDSFQGFRGDLDPKAKAAAWYQRMLPHIQQAPWACWEAFNEPPADAAMVKAYGEFEAERQRIMADNGFKCCIGNFAVGTPDFPIWSEFYPALEAAHQYHNLIGLHEYGALWLDAFYGPNQLRALQVGQRQPMPAQYAEGWLTFRYRMVWNQHIKPNGWTNARIALTEFGLMSAAPPEINAIAGDPVGSWKTCGKAWSKLDGRPDTEQYYVEQLEWVDRQMQADPYMVGATIFTWGTFPDSAWQADEIDGAVAEALCRHIDESGTV